MDIHVRSLERRRQTTVGSRVNARLELLFLALENNCVKTNTDRPTPDNGLTYTNLVKAKAGK